MAKTKRCANRCALYIRVSRQDQHTENQAPDLEALAKARGFTIAKRYEEKVSGASASRPAYDRMMADASQGAFEYVLVWKLDRLGRRGWKTFADIAALYQDHGVAVVSAREPDMDMSGMAGRIVCFVAAEVAAAERETLIERTRAGLERARKAGKVLGRRRDHVRLASGDTEIRRFDLAKAKRLAAEGKSTRAIALELGTSQSKVSRRLREAQSAESKTPPAE